jgi:nitronate monooxygenase
MAKATTQPWGVGFITWSATRKVLDQALAHHPHAVMLSFGDPRPFAPAIKSANCRLICQVQDLAGARLAQEAGADIIVAQGTEAGGHGGKRATFPLVPAVVDAVAPVPVLAAGGIADGRGLAAALMLGAQGVLLGTRFYASTEALGHPAAKERIAGAHGDDTQRTHVFDIVRGYDWPSGFDGRALRNRFMQRWHGHEFTLAGEAMRQRAAFYAAAEQGDLDTTMVWAGEAVDLIREVQGAGALVASIGEQAQAQLRAASRWVQ